MESETRASCTGTKGRARGSEAALWLARRAKSRPRTWTDRRAEGGARCVDDAPRIKDRPLASNSRVAGHSVGQAFGSCLLCSCSDAQTRGMQPRGYAVRARRRHLCNVDRPRSVRWRLLARPVITAAECPGLGSLSQMSVEAFSGAPLGPSHGDSRVRSSFNSRCTMVSRSGAARAAASRMPRKLLLLRTGTPPTETDPL